LTHPRLSPYSAPDAVHKIRYWQIGIRRGKYSGNSGEEFEGESAKIWYNPQPKLFEGANLSTHHLAMIEVARKLPPMRWIGLRRHWKSPSMSFFQYLHPRKWLWKSWNSRF
jgi:hypothetical protein